MKRWVGFSGGFLVLLGIVGILFRGSLREAYRHATARKLPEAVAYQPAALNTTLAGDQGALVEGGSATSEHFTLISSPPPAPVPIDPFDRATPLPKEKNLDIPFVSQAPLGDWAMPYQEACEEASAIMVDLYYNKISSLSKEDAKQKIDDLVAYETKTFGEYEDTDAKETARFIRGFFAYRDIRTLPLKSVDQLKRAVANGYPVLVPAAGKLLPNPNFRNGGPLYHMFVVKGYTEDRFITNDPGTRNGANYTYTFDELMHAAHDWNDGDVEHGDPMMIIVLPN